MRIPFKLGWLAAAAVATLPLAASCEDDLGAEHCDEPGSDEKCECPDGRVSVRTCDAFNTWGACYCNTTGCGNGTVESGEQCDDGNLDNNDGCNENCLLESANGGGGAGPGPGGFGGVPGTGGAPGGMGGLGGSGGALGGMGGLGGLGGAGGVGGNGGSGGN